jgi:hypothetical protein
VQEAQEAQEEQQTWELLQEQAGSKFRGRMMKMTTNSIQNLSRCYSSTSASPGFGYCSSLLRSFGSVSVWGRDGPLFAPIPNLKSYFQNLGRVVEAAEIDAWHELARITKEAGVFVSQGEKKKEN